jgi:hypothetical protein
VRFFSRQGRVSLLVLAISMIGVASATSVSVVPTSLQAQVGFVTGVYFASSSAMGSTTPSANTQTASPLGSGSYALGSGLSAYLWSPQFLAAQDLSAGNWAVDLWAAGSSSGTATVSVYVTDSTGAIISTIASQVVTGTIGTTATQVVLVVSGGLVTIPAGGYLDIVVDNPPPQNINTLTLYWGTGQLSNFQAPLGATIV